ncbi:hypothetical protein [Azospirillum sp. sgz302134]
MKTTHATNRNPPRPAVAAIHEELIDANGNRVHPGEVGAAPDPVPAQQRTVRMAYVTQDKFNEAIDHLGRHIDRRLTSLETEVKGLRTDMVQGFEKVDQRFEAIDRRFEKIDERFERMDQRFESMDQRFEGMDQRFERMEKAQAASDKLHTDHYLELKAELAASNKLHNDNHLELKQMLGVLLQEIRNK